MKTVLLFAAGIALLCSACDDAKEEPPRTDDIARQYLIPQAIPLTPEERALIKTKRDEYKQAVQSVNSY